MKDKELYHAGQHISFQQALEYEIHGHWLTFWIWWSDRGKRWVVRYATWKAKRKYERYQWTQKFSVW